MLSILSGCSWLIPRLFPENVPALPPAPVKEYYCGANSNQIVGPHGPTNIALAELWNKNPNLSVKQIFRLLVLSSSRFAPHLIAPESQQESIYIPNVIPATQSQELFISKLKASTTSELINGPLFNAPYSELEIRFLDQIRGAMFVGDSLEKFLLSKLKIAQRRKDQTYFHKNNGQLLNRGDPLPDFPIQKLWKKPSSIGADQISKADPRWVKINTNSPSSSQCYFHEFPPAKKNSEMITSFPSEVLILSVVAKNGESIIGLFGQNPSAMKTIDTTSPYWKGSPTSLGYWCQLQNQIVIAHGKPEVGEWIIEHLPAQFQGAKEANQFQELGRVMKASSPPRLLVESERLNAGQLKEALSQNIPSFYENNLGNVNILVPNQNTYTLAIDPRINEEMTCF